MTPQGQIEINHLLESFSVHFWVKDTIKIMLKKDPVDCLENVALLKRVADILNHR